MAPKLFCTGVTGYIGGDAFYEIFHAHQDWEYTCLVRNSDKGALVAKTYPSVRLVYGDLDTNKVLEEEVARADIVLHFASADHEAAVRAIIQGLSSHSAEEPAYFIHTSGTGTLLFHDLQSGTFGEDHPKIYDDVGDIKELLSLPDDAPHRNIEKIVLAVKEPGVKTAIVSPPTIYGNGRGPGNQRSVQIPGLAQGMLSRGKAFQVGQGRALWSHVHVTDLSRVYLLLTEAAVDGGGRATWGPQEGYYFVEAGEHRWGDLSHQLAARAHEMKLLKSTEVESISGEEANKLHPFGSGLWGANSRSRASRIRFLFGWKAQGARIADTLEEVLKEEDETIKKGK